MTADFKKKLKKLYNKFEHSMKEVDREMLGQILTQNGYSELYPEYLGVEPVIVIDTESDADCKRHFPQNQYECSEYHSGDELYTFESLIEYIEFCEKESKKNEN